MGAHLRSNWKQHLRNSGWMRYLRLSRRACGRFSFCGCVTSAPAKTSRRIWTLRCGRSGATSCAGTSDCGRRWRTDMARHIEIPTSIREEAAEWWDRLYDEEPSAADNREFAAWISRSSERVEAYLEVARLHRGLGSPRIRWPTADREELIREAKSAPEDSWPM